MSADRDRRELEVLYRLAVSLPRSLTVTGVTDALAEGLVDAIERACECTITSWERDANTLTVLSVCEPGGIEPSWRGVEYDLADWPDSLAVLEAGSEHREFRLSEAELEPRVREQVEEWTWASWICFPLIVENRAVGLIELADYDSADPWSPRDIVFGQTIATQAALAVRNAQLYEDLQRQVDHDSLTGLLNHGAFYSRFDEELERIRRSGRPAAALIVDLDDFKLVNDRDGHPAGDRTLRRSPTRCAPCAGSDGRRRADRRRRVLRAAGRPGGRRRPGRGAAGAGDRDGGGRVGIGRRGRLPGQRPHRRRGDRAGRPRAARRQTRGQAHLPPGRLSRRLRPCAVG